MRALKVCSTPGCPTLVRSGRCAECTARAEAARGSSRARGYDRAHERRFRPGVLRRYPLCVCEDPTHGHGAPCLRAATVADHHPLSRRELVHAGLDPNDPQYGRGLCAPCHDRETAVNQPGGWNRR